MKYGQPSKTIRTLLGVVAKAWLSSAPDSHATMESFVGAKMKTRTESENMPKKDTQKPEKGEQKLSTSMASALLEMDKDFG